MDKTGVGAGPIELFDGLDPFGITITGGDQVHRGDSPRDWRVPKRDLVGAMQVGLQSQGMKIAGKLPMAQTLVRELLNFKMKMSEQGQDTYGAWRESIHDDLVLAASISCYVAQQIIGLKAGQALDEIGDQQRAAQFAQSRVRISPF